MAVLLASCIGKQLHFISDATYRSHVEQDFRKKQALMPQGDLFSILDTPLTGYEREALQFLYAYMPLADITDYLGSFHLMNVHLYVLWRNVHMLIFFRIVRICRKRLII